MVGVGWLGRFNFDKDFVVVLLVSDGCGMGLMISTLPNAEKEVVFLT